MDTPVDPLLDIAEAFARARSEEPVDASAMALASADTRGRPSVRMVLLRGVDERGFVFFTNYLSRKGQELTDNPYAALCIHWAKAERQVRAEGPVSRVSVEESDAYFATRPRGSQLGAWASAQSEPIESRQALLERLHAVEARFGDGPVPRPEHWGGFRLEPERIELWHGQRDRLHERILYTRQDGAWQTRILMP
jgi:pyridoxamine 5'-phosphate oxidase